MTWLLAGGVLAQGLDAATMDLSRESNAVVLHLGLLAYLAKIALILGVTALAWSLPRLRSTARSTRLQCPAALALSVTLLIVGLLGTISNLLAA